MARLQSIADAVSFSVNLGHFLSGIRHEVVPLVEPSAQRAGVVVEVGPSPRVAVTAAAGGTQGGRLRLSSEPGVGMRAVVSLPRARDPEEDDA